MYAPYPSNVLVNFLFNRLVCFASHACRKISLLILDWWRSKCCCLTTSPAQFTEVCWVCGWRWWQYILPFCRAIYYLWEFDIHKGIVFVVLYPLCFSPVIFNVTHWGLHIFSRICVWVAISRQTIGFILHHCHWHPATNSPLTDCQWQWGNLMLIFRIGFSFPILLSLVCDMDL